MSSGEDPFHFVRARSILAVIGLCVLAILIPYRAIEGVVGETWAPIATELGIYLSVGLVLGWLCRRSGIDLGLLVGEWPGVGEALRTAALALPLIALSLGTLYAVYLPLSYVAPGFVEGWLLEPSPLLVHDENGYPALPNLCVFVSTCLLAPAIEEFVFRGLFLHRWTTRWNLPRAIVVSSILFGALHTDVIGSALFGVVAAILYLETRSLYPPLVLHVTNNLAAYLMSVGEVAVLGTEPELDLAAFRSYAWVGAAGLAVGGPWTWRFLRHHWRPDAWILPLHRGRGPG